MQGIWRDICIHVHVRGFVGVGVELWGKKWETGFVSGGEKWFFEKITT